MTGSRRKKGREIIMLFPRMGPQLPPASFKRHGGAKQTRPRCRGEGPGGGARRSRGGQTGGGEEEGQGSS